MAKKANAIIRAALAAVLAGSLAVPPAWSAEGLYVFRYNSGFVTANAGGPSGPETPTNPNQYDVTARFFGMVGESFDSRIPTKPGAHVTSWRIESGVLPEGLSFDDATGTISGTPTEETALRALSVRGYAPSGDMGTYAQVKIDIVAKRDGALKQEAYGHTNKPFYAAISKPEGVQVDSWTSSAELPSWASLVNGSIQGNPPQAGVWPFAFTGLDIMGQEIAYTYGQIVVEDGPAVEFVPDLVQNHDYRFLVAGSVQKSVGNIRWELEGDALPSELTFRPQTGTITGLIPAFDVSGTFRLRAIDADGAVGLSNDFVLGTLPADLQLSAVPTQHLTLNKADGFSFDAKELSGTQSWSIAEGSLPDGVSIDPSTGRVSGTPTMTGTWSGVVVEVSTSVSAPVRSNAFDIVVDPDELKARVAKTDVRVEQPFSTPAPVVTGGVPPYAFAVAEGGTLPDGVTLDPATGILSGSLSRSGEQNVSIVPKDSTDRTGDAFTVGIHGFDPLTAYMPQGSYSGPRLSPLSAKAETPDDSAMPPAVWSIAPTTLPPGMSFEAATGSLEGTPTLVGEYGPYTMTVTDRTGENAQTNPFTVSVVEMPDIAVEVSDVEVSRYYSNQASAGTVNNYVGNVTWTLAEDSAALPEGITLIQSGKFVGVASATEAVAGVIVKVTDSEGRTTTSAPFKITPVQPGAVTATIGGAFKWPVGFAFTTPAPSVKNAVGTWTASTSSTLPGWATLDPETGTLSGTAPATGTYGAFDVTVTDVMDRQGNFPVTLQITPPMDVSIAATVQINRLGSIPPLRPAVTDGIGRIDWTLSGQLPEGMSFDPSSGYVTGIPQVEGSFPVVFTAHDVAGQVHSAPTTIKVNPRLPLSLAYSVPTLYQGYGSGLPAGPAQPINAAGKVTYDITGTLPSGITFDRETGLFKGVPSDTGTWSGIVVSGVDEEGVSATSQPFDIDVTLWGPVHVSQPVTRSMRAGVASTTEPVEVTNVKPPLTFHPSSGSVLNDPDGLVLIANSGSLTGVANTLGQRTHLLRVEDALGRTADFSLGLKVVGDLSVSFPDITGHQHFPITETSGTLSNVIGDYTARLTPSTLPAGLALASNLRIIGTPSVMGSFGPYTLTVTDSTGDQASATFNIDVGTRLALVASFPKSDWAAIAHQPFMITPTLQNAVGPVTWSIQSGTLPDGMTLNPSNGRISGTPTMTGTWENIVLKATDSKAGVALANPITIDVQLDGQPIGLVTANLTWKLGLPFSTSVPSVTNEIGDIFFRSPQAQALGLSVDPATGVISGTVQTAGHYVVDLSVTDSTNRVTSEPIVLDVMPNIRLTAKPAVYAVVNTPLAPTSTVTTEYGYGAVTYSLNGTLPAGLVFQATTGNIYGTATAQVKVEGLTVTATDALGDTATSAPFTVEVLDDGSVPTFVSLPDYGVMKVGDALTSAQSANPSVNGKKQGDVYTINKALPAGLSLNTATGAISGTPAPGSHGIHDGYVIHVMSLAGLGSDSQPFTLKIRHQDTPTYQTMVADFYDDQIDLGPVTILTHPEAIIGSARFAWGTPIAGLTLNTATGAISGSMSMAGGQSGTIIVSDDIGPVGSPIPVVITRKDMFPNLTVTAGQTALTFPPYVQMMGWPYTGKLVYVTDIFPNVVDNDPVVLRMSNLDAAGVVYLYVCKDDKGSSTDPNRYVCDADPHNGTPSNGMWVTEGINFNAYKGNTVALMMVNAPSPGVSKRLQVTATYHGVVKTFVWTVTGK